MAPWPGIHSELQAALARVTVLERALADARVEIEVLEDENARIRSTCELSRVRLEAAIGEIESLL
jgi:sigma54-dependent transcription regulator